MGTQRSHTNFDFPGCPGASRLTPFLLAEKECLSTGTPGLFHSLQITGEESVNPAINPRMVATGKEKTVQSGEPPRNRTWNLLIKSQLLCQLS